VGSGGGGERVEAVAGDTLFVIGLICMHSGDCPRTSPGQDEPLRETSFYKL
jgi:hypothetical protein